MKYSFKLLLSIILAIWLLGTPTAALAQEEPDAVTGLEEVTLQVYAEFDDPYELGPNVLTIFSGRVAGAIPTIEAPVDVRFMVPSGVVMYSAGYKDATGTYKKGYDYDGPPLTEASGIPGWDLITITMKSSIFVVEYYDNDIITGDKEKTISYQFRSRYPVSGITAFVQAPAGASKFEVTPSGQAAKDGAYDYYYYSFSDLEAEAPLEFEISYSVGGVNPLLITGVIVGVFVIFAVIYFWSKRSTTATRAERRRSLKHKPVKQVSSPIKGAAPAKFCRHCGQKLERPSKFCPYCGGAL